MEEIDNIKNMNIVSNDDMCYGEKTSREDRGLEVGSWDFKQAGRGKLRGEGI